MKELFDGWGALFEPPLSGIGKSVKSVKSGRID